MGSRDGRSSAAANDSSSGSFVDDLHNLTPNEYIEYGDGIFHDLSYQQARHFYRPPSGVYVANPGYVFGTAAIPRASLITEINGAPLRDLDDFQKMIETLTNGSQVRIRFITFDDPRSEKQRIITNDRDWFPALRCGRDDFAGIWPCRELVLSAAAEALAPQATTFPARGRGLRPADCPVARTRQLQHAVHGIRRVRPLLLRTGVVADADRGWVVVDRNTVPVAMGDVRVTIAGSLEIPGACRVHPSAAQSRGRVVRSGAHRRYARALRGIRRRRTRHRQWGRRRRSRSRSQGHVAGEPRRERVAGQFPVVAYDQVPRHESRRSHPRQRSGRFRWRHRRRAGGRVLAHWASFAYQTGRDLTQVNMGIPSDLIIDMIERLRSDQPLRSIEVEWLLMPLATARKLDLPESWASRYEAHNPTRRQTARRLEHRRRLPGGRLLPCRRYPAQRRR